ISGLTISGGSAGTGGGILSLATLTLDAVTISGNFATNGGGLYNKSANLKVTNSTFSDNSVSGTVSGSGGGIFSFARQITLNTSTFSGNTAVENHTNYDDSRRGIYANVGNSLLASCTLVC